MQVRGVGLSGVKCVLKSHDWDEALVDIVFICVWEFCKLLEDKFYLERTKAIRSTELGHNLEEILKGYFLVFAGNGSAQQAAAGDARDRHQGYGHEHHTAKDRHPAAQSSQPLADKVLGPALL